MTYDFGLTIPTQAANIPGQLHAGSRLLPLAGWCARQCYSATAGTPQLRHRPRQAAVVVAGPPEVVLITLKLLGSDRARTPVFFR